MLNKYFMGGCLAWGGVIFLLFFIRPKARLHYITLETFENNKKVFVIFTVIIIGFVCTLPMGLSPIWNGEIPEHRSQYEHITEAILDGHLYFDYEVDPALMEMENPYDPQARADAGVKFYWDHAYYKGHYYMYFGVVPVFLIFLPYRIIMGHNLNTFHATQIFVMLFLIGIFAVFYKMARCFFREISLGMYLFMSSAFAVMSIWYSIGAPALYSTAITAGLCMQIWSIFFFCRHFLTKVRKTLYGMLFLEV